MKILYVVNGVEFGGVSRHVLALLEHLQKAGHAVGIVSAPEPRLLSEALRLGARFFPNPYFVRQVRLHHDIRALGPVFQAIKTFQPDLVSAHSTKAGFAARFSCALLGVKPVVFTAHGWAFTEGRAYWKRWLLARAERVTAKVTTKIICVSEHDRRLALKLKVSSCEQLVVINNGMPPQPFLDADGVKVRSELGLDNTTVFTMVGRLAPPKDPLMLLRALLSLNISRSSRVKALIIGDGVLKPQVERFVQLNGLAKDVILAGERFDVPELLAASDVFVLPSRWEGLPRSIIEAMMAGLPVVATRVGGIPELVEDGLTGFIVDPGDSEALAEAVRNLLRDEGLRKRMGQAGREKALRAFTLDRMLGQTCRVYEQLLKEYP